MSKRRLMASDDLLLLPLAFQWRCFSFYHLWFQSSVLPSKHVDANGWCPRAGAFSVWNSGFRPKRWQGGERTHVSVTRSGVSQGGRSLRGSHRLTGVTPLSGSLWEPLPSYLFAPRHLRSAQSSWAHTRWQHGTLVMRGSPRPWQAEPQGSITGHTDTHTHASWRVPASQRSSVTALDLATWASVLETSPQDCSSPFYCPVALFKHGKRTLCRPVPPLVVAGV